LIIEHHREGCSSSGNCVGALSVSTDPEISQWRTHDYGIKESCSDIWIDILLACSGFESQVTIMARIPGKVLCVPLIVSRRVKDRRTSSPVSSRFKGLYAHKLPVSANSRSAWGTSYLKPIILDSMAEMMESIILSCQLKSPDFIARSLLHVSPAFYTGTNDLLDIHRYTTFTNDDWYLPQLLSTRLDDILDLQCVILFGSLSTEIKGIQDEHSLHRQHQAIVVVGSLTRDRPWTLIESVPNCFLNKAFKSYLVSSIQI